jgi:hypothetical protein
MYVCLKEEKKDLLWELFGKGKIEGMKNKRKPFFEQCKKYGIARIATDIIREIYADELEESKKLVSKTSAALCE